MKKLKSQHNFQVIKGGQEYDMHSMGVWVESFHIYAPNAKKTTLSFPGMPGGHLMNSNQGVRPVEISLQIEADNMLDFDNLKHVIFDLFYSDEEFSIKRDLTPDKDIFVIQEGTYDIENITQSDGKFQISLSMLDPYIYGKEKIYNLNSDIGSVIPVEGTAETMPVFELQAQAPITFAMVSNGPDYFMIGNPTAVEETAVDKEPRIFHNYMQNQTGWVDFSNVLEGYINGSVANNDDNVYPVFGTPEAGRQEWNGPARKHALSEAVQDFRAETWLHFLSDNVGRTGRIEMYLLNDLNEMVGVARIEDRWHGMDQLVCYLVLAGGVETPPIMLPPRLEAFKGNLKVTRKGDEWTLTVQQIGQGEDRVLDEWSESIISTSNTDAISQIAYSFQRFYDDLGASVDIYSMRLYKLNDVAGTPYIAHAGDTILLDFVNHEIRINGELRMELKDRGAAPFSLKPGDNTLVLLPAGNLSGTVKFKPASR